MVRHHALAPIGKESNPADEDQKRSGSKSPEPKRENQDETERETMNSKGFRKDERGKAKKGREFSDQPLLGDLKAKIVSLKVWKLDNKLSGIQATYYTRDGRTIQGGQHCSNSNGNVEVFAPEKGDYIKEISGFIDRTEGAIECLIITSFKGESKRIGEPKKTSKLFKFDINELEFPACIYGTLKGI